MPGAVRTLPRPLAERLAAFVERTLGLFYPEERWVDLERGVGLAAEELGYRDATACAEHLLAAPPAHAVVETLTAHLTVGETFFFRGMETFQALEHEILPAVLDLPHHRGDPALRVWSAACSTGEEPYTLAMILRSAAHEIIRHTQESYHAVLEKITDAVRVSDPDGSLRYANPSAVRLLADASPGVVLPSAFGNYPEFEVRQADGSTLFVDVQVQETFWEGAPAALSTLRDVTSAVLQKRELQDLAFNDPLTGLNNRRGFLRAAQVRMQESAVTGVTLLLFFIDLDGMKRVNDTLGHQQGDHFLQDAAQVLRRTFRRTDLLGRLGGDEFAAIAPEVPKGNAEVLIRRLQENLADYNRVVVRPFEVAFSVGMVVYQPSEPRSIEDLIAEADTRMYQEKRRKKVAVSS